MVSPANAHRDQIVSVENSRGIRLIQHGTILSETRRSPGATHTAADLLAALTCVLSPQAPIGVLGFAGGGIVAALRALGWRYPIDTVDLDRRGHQLFRKLCRQWAGQVRFTNGDAIRWLMSRNRRYHLIIEDLSISQNGDTVKPEIVWSMLPNLIRARLTKKGFAVFNLLPAPSLTWKELLTRICAPYEKAQVIRLQDYENQIVIAGNDLPTAAGLRRALTNHLHQLKSNMAGQLSVRTLAATSARPARN